MRATLSIDTSDLRAMILAGREVYPGAAARSLNRAVAAMRRPIARVLVQEFHLRQQKTINRRVKFRKATASRLSAEIRILARPLSVIHVAGVQDRRPQGVSGSGRSYPSAFIAKGIGGNQRVFQRRGKARKPIDAINIDIQQAVQRAVEAELPKARDRVIEELPRELTYRMQRAGLGGWA